MKPYESTNDPISERSVSRSKPASGLKAGVEGVVGDRVAEPLLATLSLRGYGSPGFVGRLLRFVARFFSPGGKGLSSSR